MADSSAFQSDSGTGTLNNYVKFPLLADSVIGYFVFILKTREQDSEGREHLREKVIAVIRLGGKVRFLNTLVEAEAQGVQRAKGSRGKK